MKRSRGDGFIRSVGPAAGDASGASGASELADFLAGGTEAEPLASRPHSIFKERLRRRLWLMRVLRPGSLGRSRH